jgi:hypothetical protein
MLSLFCFEGSHEERASGKNQKVLGRKENVYETQDRE